MLLCGLACPRILHKSAGTSDRVL